MDVIEKAKRILNDDVCDHCLGRQYAQLGTGYTNAERGRIVRAMIEKNVPAGEIDQDEPRKFVFDKRLLKSSKKSTTKETGKCSVCGNFFDDMDKWVVKIKKAAKGLDYETFLVGTIMSDDLIEREESLWEKVGIDYCEPIKSEINREVGKLVERATKKKFDKNPDIMFLLDVTNESIRMQIKSIMFYGEYQKLIRGIPQTRWPSGKYKTSIEQIMAKPFLAAAKGTGTRFHGAGREDIDARCLGWRPFVLEIRNPKKRLTLKEVKSLMIKVPKNKIRVKNVHLSTNEEVAKLKSLKLEKTYSCLVVCKKEITKDDLKKLNALVGEIEQHTPMRVLHRRADLLRKRNILSLKTEYVNKKTFRLTIRTDAGTYVKEFVSGDNGRTRPSISDVLGMECTCTKLDVIKIHF